MRDRIRMLLLFTPWVSIPLALLGVFLAVLYPLMQWTWIGWVIYDHVRFLATNRLDWD